MASSYAFPFPLSNGLHARPASQLQEVASRFRCDVTLVVGLDEAGGAVPAGETLRNDRLAAGSAGHIGRSGNVKSVLALISMDVQQGEPCVLRASGTDEAAAIEALGLFIRESLARTENAAEAQPTPQSTPALPRSLTASGLSQFFRGRVISGGIGRGWVVVAQGGRPDISPEGRRAESPDEEIRRLESAISRLRSAMTEQSEAATRSPEREILKAHVAILQDIEFREKAMSGIAAGESAIMAVVEASEHFALLLGAARSGYLRERAQDIRDVCGQLLESLGERKAPNTHCLDRPTIYVAESLAPSELLKLSREHLKGLVLRDGGSTSHTVILARSMGIPTLVAVDEAPQGFKNGQEALVDGETGIVIPSISEAIRRYYELETEKIDRLRRAIAAKRFEKAVTRDGCRIEVGCNVSSAEEVSVGIAAGAEGIGLFRTEMLFVARSAPPSEAEQLAVYKKAVVDGVGHSVILRLIDIGGDKPAPYLGLAPEENPFLGYRGVRIYAEHKALLMTQIRAVLRAGGATRPQVNGNGDSVGGIRLLVPMIGCVEELRAVRAMVTEAKADLEKQDIRCLEPPIGVMIEVPSAVMMIRELAQEADFFSIGSNDLTQYCMAADRGNERVAGLCTWSQPAFLRMLKAAVDGARAPGVPRRWIGLCGEMVDSAEALPLLVGLGLDEISVSIPRIAAVKAAVAAMKQSDCATLAAKVMACSTQAEVAALLAAPRVAEVSLPILSDDLIILDSDARSKEEAIKVLCDALAVGGWANNSALVEEAIWRREDTYSTGFGHGFAVPHCKSEHMRSHAIAVARLGTPVQWGSTDGEPVDIVILLAIRSDTQERAHMKVFSQLSRLTMREEFRRQFRAEKKPEALRAFLENSLSLGMAAVTTNPEISE